MLITAAMSSCHGADLIGTINAAPMRLASPKSFMDGLGEVAVNDAIVRLIVDFAHTLGLKVTTEGVENEQQMASLTAVRCDLTQGFYFSKPLRSVAAGRSLLRTLCGGRLNKDTAVAAGIDLIMLGGSDPTSPEGDRQEVGFVSQNTKSTGCSLINCLSRRQHCR